MFFDMTVRHHLSTVTTQRLHTHLAVRWSRRGVPLLTTVLPGFVTM